MDDRTAQAVADAWSGGAGLVPRGPKLVLATRPVTPSEVERHTGRRPQLGGLWRLEVGGRFLRSGGLVYPSGVPFPEELHSRTAVIANEVWLYVDDDGRVLGVYWWPDALRRPIASTPKDEYPPEHLLHPSTALETIGFPLKLPDAPPWEPMLAVCCDPDEVLVFLTHGTVPDPVHEMLVYEHGGLSLRARAEATRPNIDAYAQQHSPPYRRVRAPGSSAVGRESGRALGPQTWPWPAELRWWDSGVAYELKGFVSLAQLQDVAATISA